MKEPQDFILFYFTFIFYATDHNLKTGKSFSSVSFLLRKNKIITNDTLSISIEIDPCDQRIKCVNVILVSEFFRSCWGSQSFSVMLHFVQLAMKRQLIHMSL